MFLLVGSWLCCFAPSYPVITFALSVSSVVVILVSLTFQSSHTSILTLFHYAVSILLSTAFSSPCPSDGLPFPEFSILVHSSPLPLPTRLDLGQLCSFSGMQCSPLGQRIQAAPGEPFTIHPAPDTCM